MLPGQDLGWGPSVLPASLVQARKWVQLQTWGVGLWGWLWGTDPSGGWELWGGWSPERLGPGKAPAPAQLGHAWHAARGPVRSVCAPRAPIGMREPARRGREAGALAGRAGEAAAGHVLTRSARVGTAASQEGETEERIQASS